MGGITRASHGHYCPGCGNDWPHPGYRCEAGTELACEKHAVTTVTGTMTDPKKAAQQAVGRMVDGMKKTVG